MTEIWDQFTEYFRDAVKAIADGLSFLGTHKWAGAIIVITIIVRTLLLPLAMKQIRSSQAMQRLAPEIKRLQQKYKKDKQKLNQEMMELYKREGVNPLAGCLPLLPQMPILFAMYYAIRGITDPIAKGGLGVTNIPFIGLANSCARDVAAKVTKCGLAAPAKATIAGVILIIVMTGTSYLSTRQMTAGQDPQQARIAKLMPLFFVFIMIRLPGALVLYWTTQNIYQLVQQTIMLGLKTIQFPPRDQAGSKPVRRKPGKPQPPKPKAKPKAKPKR